MQCRYQYCMTGVINNVLSNGNHTNDNNTTMLSFSLLAAAAAVTVACSWIRHVYIPNRVHTTLTNLHLLSRLSVSRCDELCTV